MKTTGLRRRFGAILYDTVLVLALYIMTTYAFVAFNGGEAIDPDNNLVFQLVLVFVIYLFFVGFWTRAGRTLGMQSWRLQLEDMEGGRPGLLAATIRFFSAPLSWVVLLLGFFWQLWDKDKLTWHDRLSKTRIVYYPKDDGSES